MRGDALADVPPAGEHRGYGADELAAAGILVHIAVGAELESAEGILMIGMDAQYEAAGFRAEHTDLSQQIDPVGLRKSDVQENDIVRSLFKGLIGLGDGGCLIEHGTKILPEH